MLAGMDTAVVGLGDLRTTAHINAKLPLYNFLARCGGREKRAGDAEYWRGLVETWCEDEGVQLRDCSTKQVSLYLRQMAQVRLFRAGESLDGGHPQTRSCVLAWSGYTVEPLTSQVELGDVFVRPIAFLRNSSRSKYLLVA